MSDQSIWLERDRAFEAKKLLESFEKYFYVHIDYSEITGDKVCIHLVIYPSEEYPSGGKKYGYGETIHEAFSMAEKAEVVK